MKKTYQRPIIEATAIVPIQVIAATVNKIDAKSGSEDINLEYGGGSSMDARAGESNLWDDEDHASGWD
ncbi:MAG: hypothetical protein J6Y97_07845 [Prevotella sp.]|nr:hypothetical protein [Prevotella sp.]MBP5506943.1 hypothetical protein [Prevotella sp.]